MTPELPAVQSGQRLVGRALVEWSKLPAMYVVDKVLLVDKDGRIKPAARAVAAASLKVSQGEEVPEYEDLATKYNLLARREAKRRSPTAAGSALAAGAAVSTDALAELMRRQTEILLDIRAELSALRERTGAGTPPVEDSDTYEDDYGFDLAVDGQARG
ncbi:hypothetical protein THAR02_03075 [Trichoderma harzianum]|uniref:Uncharacterized protein n=1 Tax=Trichoderma harzianum TaxID=5544 RepID=A0A0F9ZXV4_TRIHA|nr:hypothetical protein THAR02_03075 [Trichoderma harzianum]